MRLVILQTLCRFEWRMRSTQEGAFFARWSSFQARVAPPTSSLLTEHSTLDLHTTACLAVPTSCLCEVDWNQ